MAGRFLRRWARRKSAYAARAQSERREPPEQTSNDTAPLPGLREVALLGADADYSVFVAQGIDTEVHRAAMKKLFSDPHFNVMDGLDIYIADYQKTEPLTAAMLAALEHARTTLPPLLEETEDTDGEAQGEPRTGDDKAV